MACWIALDFVIVGGNESIQEAHYNGIVIDQLVRFE